MLLFYSPHNSKVNSHVTVLELRNPEQFIVIQCYNILSFQMSFVKSNYKVQSPFLEVNLKPL